MGKITEENLTYDQAIVELTQILSELESADIDVDVLAEKVERGETLISFCSDRLKKVSTEVENLISDSADSPESSEDAE
jgi:exodeoxyribonuclease VII small subunit